MKNNIVVGHCLGGGPVIRGLVAAAALLFSVNVSATLVIDNFSDTMIVEAEAQSLCGEANSSMDPSSIIMGTQRDMSILNAQGKVRMTSHFVGILIIEQFEQEAEEILLQWDGVDSDGSNTSPCNLNHTGLGGEDLTQGGVVRKLHLMVSSDKPNDTRIDIRIYTDATQWSSYLLEVDSDQITSYVIEHEQFTTGEGADEPVDFANVGAIEMKIIVPTGRVSLGFDLIETSVTLGKSSVQVVPSVGGLPGGLMFKWNTLEEFNNAGFVVGQRVAGGDDDDWEPLSGFMEADNPSGATYHAFVCSDPCTDCEYGIADIDTDRNITIHVIE